MPHNEAPGRYWGRKPPWLIRQLLEPGDEVVVDPFGGTGTIAEVALEEGRRVIYSDINPYAWLIAHVTLAGADSGEFKEALAQVLAKAPRLEDGVEARLRDDWLRYRDGSWFLKARGPGRVSGFFPESNLRRLMALLRAIDELDASVETKLALYLAFTNAVHQASYMRRPSGGAWAVPCYWIPVVNQPLDAYVAFERAAGRLAGRLHGPREVCYSLGCGGDAVLLLEDALALRYGADWTLVTDPPFGEDIQYMELSFLYWAFLRISQLPLIMGRLLGRRVTYPFSRELVVNEARGVGLGEYLSRLRAFLRATGGMRRRVLIFSGEDESLAKAVAELIREEWGGFETRLIRVDSPRRLGAGRGVRYLVVEA